MTYQCRIDQHAYTSPLLAYEVREQARLDREDQSTTLHDRHTDLLGQIGILAQQLRQEFTSLCHYYYWKSPEQQKLLQIGGFVRDLEHVQRLVGVIHSFQSKLRDNECARHRQTDRSNRNLHVQRSKARALKIAALLARGAANHRQCTAVMREVTDELHLDSLSVQRFNRCTAQNTSVLQRTNAITLEQEQRYARLAATAVTAALVIGAA